MINVTLPDGKCLHFHEPVQVFEIARSISSSLAKKAFIARVNGALVDLSFRVDTDSSVEILTKESPEALDVLRHDTAHILAQAAKELYGESIQVTIGPSIENGFYYDFERATPFSTDDLVQLESKMKEIVARDDVIYREEWSRDQCLSYFKKQGELYKAELIESIPEGETLSLYRHGDFIDLCRGPHGPSTGKIGKAFKLLKVAGAYWRGDSKNPMLQRIYGTAWATEKDLETYLFQQEEAEKRDHRKLGREMNLFHLQEEAAGSVFWHPHGWRLYRTLQSYMRAKLEKNDYQEVNTPLLIDSKLWEESGHMEKFSQHMFTLKSLDDRTLALKPMNCPAHIQIFKQGIKSYRDLPLRLAEFGCCHRNEPSGALHGIMRVRNFVQDDAHIFCTLDQVLGEAKKFCQLLTEIYKNLGFPDFTVRFSDRAPVRAGDDATWDRAEHMLKQVLEELKISYDLNPGEGAFYGPKLEFVLKDAMGRSWQCGTLQLDFILPKRLDATYVGEDGNKHHPVMLHRAILGTFERFIGILIEHYGGKFPLWLAPVQIVVAPIVTACNDYAEQVKNKFEAAGLSVDLDDRSEKITYKIREHSLAKVPYIAVIGNSEKENGTVTLRKLGSQHQETLALLAALDKLKNEAQQP